MLHAGTFHLTPHASLNRPLLTCPICPTCGLNADHVLNPTGTLPSPLLMSLSPARPMNTHADPRIASSEHRISTHCCHIPGDTLTLPFALRAGHRCFLRKEQEARDAVPSAHARASIHCRMPCEVGGHGHRSLHNGCMNSSLRLGKGLCLRQPSASTGGHPAVHTGRRLFALLQPQTNSSSSASLGDGPELAARGASAPARGSASAPALSG